MLDYRIGTLIEFEPISKDILGRKITGVIENIERFNRAIINSQDDLATRHQLVYTNIGEINIPDVRDSIFLEIKLSNNGNLIYIATDWIKEDSVRILSSIPQTKFTFTNLTSSQVEEIKSFLRLKGINEYTIE